MAKKKKPEIEITADNLYPLHDWVLVRKNFTNVSAGGIIYTNHKKDRPDNGTVINVGAEVTDIKRGDNIYFHWGAGTTFELNKESLSIIKIADVFGVLE